MGLMGAHGTDKCSTEGEKHAGPTSARPEGRRAWESSDPLSYAQHGPGRLATINPMGFSAGEACEGHLGHWNRL